MGASTALPGLIMSISVFSCGLDFETKLMAKPDAPKTAETGIGITELAARADCDVGNHGHLSAH